MHALRVVIEFDVLEYLLSRLRLVLVSFPLHELCLQRLEERLSDSVVVRIARPRDGLGDPVAFERVLKRTRGVLGALVGTKPKSV